MKILYLFKRPVNELIKEAEQDLKPNDSLYGLVHISRKEKIVTSDSVYFRSKFFQILQSPISSLAATFTNVGFSLIPAILIYQKLKSVDLIFTTLDTVGLPVLLLKYLRLIKQSVVYNTIGLETNLQIKKNRFARYCYSRLLQQAEVIISVASFDECKRLARYLKLPIDKFVFCPFGVDHIYFSPSKFQEENFILSVGADRRRDWATLLKAAPRFKGPLKIISAKGALGKFKIPKNVQVYENLPIAEVKTFIAKAKVVVITLKQSSYFTGQTTFFQAMSMSKPVVITKIHPFVDYPNLRDGFNCSLSKINDQEELIKKVNDLVKDKKKRTEISKNARKFILSDYTVEKYSARLLKIFRKYRGVNTSLEIL